MKIKIIIFLSSMFLVLNNIQAYNASFEKRQNDSAKREKLNQPAKSWSRGALIRSSAKEILYAANEQNEEAMYLAASSFEYGINGFNQDFLQAFLWYGELIDTKSKYSVSGYLGLANIWAKGKRQEQDIKLARYLLNKAAQLDKQDEARFYVIEDFIFGEIKTYLYVRDRAKEGDHSVQNQIIRRYDQLLRASGIGSNSSFLELKLSDSEVKHIAKQIRYWTEVSTKSKNLDVMHYHARKLLKGGFPFEKNTSQAIKIFKYISELCEIKSNASSRSAMELAKFYSHFGQMRDYVESYKWANVASYMNSSESLDWYYKLPLPELEELMSPDQISQGQAASRLWINKNCL